MNFNNDITKIGENVRHIKLSEINESPVQRCTYKKHITNIAKNFDERMFGIVSLAKFEGKYVIADGMHRVKALHIVTEKQGQTSDEVFVPCVIFEVETIEELYNLWYDLHTNTKSGKQA